MEQPEKNTQTSLKCHHSPTKLFVPQNQTEEVTSIIVGGELGEVVSAKWYKALLTNYIHFSVLLKLPNERKRKKQSDLPFRWHPEQITFSSLTF